MLRKNLIGEREGGREGRREDKDVEAKEGRERRKEGRKYIRDETGVGRLSKRGDTTNPF